MVCVCGGGGGGGGKSHSPSLLFSQIFKIPVPVLLGFFCLPPIPSDPNPIFPVKIFPNLNSHFTPFGPSSFATSSLSSRENLNLPVSRLKP